MGSASTLRQAVDLVRPGGTVLAYGIAPASVDGFNAYSFYFKELTLVGSRAMTPDTIDLAIRAVDSGSVNIAPIVTNHYPLEELQAALGLARRPEGQTLRVVVRV
ncbi:MAG: hypothetical protein M1157_05015 [Deinococcus sp.]|nr:hypothetical protein [Deinococcus sp.]